MNSFYEDDIENELQQNIHDVKEPNKNIKRLDLEQIKVEYFLCNTSTKTCVIEIYIFKIMEIKKMKISIITM